MCQNEERGAKKSDSQRRSYPFSDRQRAQRERAIENGEALPDESWQTEMELTCILDLEKKFHVLGDRGQFTRSWRSVREDDNL